jgi:hypothetical protein
MTSYLYLIFVTMAIVCERESVLALRVRVGCRIAFALEDSESLLVASSYGFTARQRGRKGVVANVNGNKYIVDSSTSLKPLDAISSVANEQRPSSTQKSVADSVSLKQGLEGSQLKMRTQKPRRRKGKHALKMLMVSCS